MQEKRKYLGTIGGGIGPLIPEENKREEKEMGLHALIDQPTELGGIGGLKPTNGSAQQQGANSLVNQPSEIDGFTELKRRRAIA